MKVLITGCQGQVGKELMALAAEYECVAVGYDRNTLDITDRTAVQNVIAQQKPDAVINAAAYTAVDKAEQEVELAYAVNREGAAHLAQACKAHNISLFHISTDYVFDGKKESPYSEKDLANPTGVYGQSKWEGEQSVRKILAQHIILRVSWVFATQGSNFVKTMLRLGKEQDELSVVVDQHGSPTCAADIAITLLKLAQKSNDKSRNPPFCWGTYHYSGRPITTWHGLAEEVFTQAENRGLIKAAPKVKKITTEEYPTPAARPKNSAMECSKIKRTFDIAQPDWKKSLNKVLTEWGNA